MVELLRVEALRFATGAAPGGDGLSEGVSFTLAAGEQAALLSPRGPLRTGLMRALALLDRPEAGRILFGEVDLVRLPKARLQAARREYQYVGGNPARTLPSHFTVGAALAEPLRIHRLGTPAEQATRAAAVLTRLGLNAWLLRQSVRALSPALRQLVSLARALSLEPRVLLTDDLTDFLEPAAAPPLVERLAALCRADGIAWLWTTADAALARRHSDRVLRLEAGRLQPA